MRTLKWHHGDKQRLGWKKSIADCTGHFGLKSLWLPWQQMQKKIVAFKCIYYSWSVGNWICYIFLVFCALPFSYKTSRKKVCMFIYNCCPKWTYLWPVFLFFCDSLARADESWMTQCLLCSWEFFCYAHLIIQWYGCYH